MRRNRRGVLSHGLRLGLLLEGHRRPADPRCFEINTDLDAVGDLDERDSAVHSILFAVEGHCPGNSPGPGPVSGELIRLE